MSESPARALRLTRRRALRLVGVPAALALLAACQPPAPSTAPTSAPTARRDRLRSRTPAPAGETQPRSGGILRQGNLGDLPTLDGNFLNGQSTIYPVWDRLVELDPQLNPKGILVESWDVDDKYTRIALHLRKGVQWHTGRELIADDVAWNIRRVSTDPKVAGGGFFNWMSQTLTGIEVSDKYTVVLLAERSWPAVFDTLSLLSIIDPVTFESAGPTKPTGTGPFTFAEYVQGDHFTLKKNPNYWQTGKPYLDGIEIKIFIDPQSMMTQLEAGAIDLVLAPPHSRCCAAVKRPAYVITFHEYSGGANLVFVQAKDGAGPTTNKLFRQALNAAIDRKRWTDAVLLGYGKPKTLPLAPPNPGYERGSRPGPVVRSGQGKVAAAAIGRWHTATRGDLERDGRGQRDRHADLPARPGQDRSEPHASSQRSRWPSSTRRTTQSFQTLPLVRPCTAICGRASSLATSTTVRSTTGVVFAVTACDSSRTGCCTRRRRPGRSRSMRIGWTTSRTRAGRCRGRTPRRGLVTPPRCTECAGIWPTT